MMKNLLKKQFPTPPQTPKISITTSKEIKKCDAKYQEEEEDDDQAMKVRVWDCGSPLYDSHELVSLSNIIDRNLMVLPGLSGSKQPEKSTRFEHGHKGRTQDLNMRHSFKHGAFIGDDEAVVSASKKNGGGASIMAFFKRKKETVRNAKRKKIRIGISNIFSSSRQSN